MLAHQNEHFVREFLKFPNSQRQNQRFPTIKIDVSCKASINFHHMSQNCHHFVERWQCDSRKTSNTTRLKCCACHTKWQWEVFKALRCAAPATKNATHLLKAYKQQKYCACHTKRLLSRHATCWNVTKCHACHAKRSDATLEKSKSDPFCRTYQRHAHSDLARTVANGCGRLRTVADGCGRLRTVAQRLANTAQPPHPQSETGTLATHSGKTVLMKCHQSLSETQATSKKISCFNWFNTDSSAHHQWIGFVGKVKKRKPSKSSHVSGLSSFNLSLFSHVSYGPLQFPFVHLSLKPINPLTVDFSPCFGPFRFQLSNQSIDITVFGRLQVQALAAGRDRQQGHLTAVAESMIPDEKTGNQWRMWYLLTVEHTMLCIIYIYTYICVSIYIYIYVYNVNQCHIIWYIKCIVENFTH